MLTWGVLLTQVLGWGLVIPIAVYVAKRTLDKSIEHVYARKLEAFKGELQRATEILRFDFQRQLHDVELFAARRHQVYAKLFTLIRIADGRARGLFGFRRVQDFDALGIEDWRRIMKAKDLPNAVQGEINDLFQEDKRSARDRLRSVLREVEVNEAESAVLTARNHLLTNEIYCSADVSARCDPILDALMDFVFRARHPEARREKPVKEEVKPDVTALVRCLRDAIAGELGRGYDSRMLGELTQPPAGDVPALPSSSADTDSQ